MESKDLTIVLVHGAWADGSQWQYIIPNLIKEGYKVRCVQNSLNTLEDDIATTEKMINAQEGSILLVGHSYGGAVISVAGNNTKVIGLIYIAAFAPDEGESVGELFAKRQTISGSNIYPDMDGRLWIKYDNFAESLCQDWDRNKAYFLGLSQRSINSKCLSTPVSNPAWKNKPTWYQVSNNDRMIDVETQIEMQDRMNTKKTLFLDSGHLSLISQSSQVSNLILDAANECI